MALRWWGTFYTLLTYSTTQGRRISTFFSATQNYLVLAFLHIMEEVKQFTHFLVA
jgi:hypothetical protein